jgi:hypothetical protein
MLIKKKRSKFNNKKVCADGHKFDSLKEYEYYRELLMRQRCGDVVSFEMQVPFAVVVNDKKICKYKADFVERLKSGLFVVVDVKGFRTPIYRLKKKLVEAIHGITIVEV